MSWDMLIEEANGYRKEIKQIAREYDVEWDEMTDEKAQEVRVALKEGREQTKKEKDDDDEDGGSVGGGSTGGKSSSTKKSKA